MQATWKQLTIVPSPEALHQLREHWSWLVADTFQPFMASASGDVFLEAPDLSIHWLDTGQGKIELIANCQEEFLSKLRSDNGVEWLLSPVIDELLAAGVSLEPDQCFAYKVLPILGGTYTPNNMVPMKASEWYGFSGHVHRQIKNLPDGAKVQFSVGL